MKKWIVIGGIVVLVAAGAGGVYYLATSDNNSDSISEESIGGRGVQEKEMNAETLVPPSPLVALIGSDFDAARELFGEPHSESDLKLEWRLGVIEIEGFDSEVERVSTRKLYSSGTIQEVELYRVKDTLHTTEALFEDYGLDSLYPKLERTVGQTINQEREVVEIEVEYFDQKEVSPGVFLNYLAPGDSRYADSVRHHLVISSSDALAFGYIDDLAYDFENYFESALDLYESPIRTEPDEEFMSLVETSGELVLITNANANEHELVDYIWSWDSFSLPDGISLGYRTDGRSFFEVTSTLNDHENPYCIVEGKLCILRYRNGSLTTLKSQRLTTDEYSFVVLGDHVEHFFESGNHSSFFVAPFGYEEVEVNIIDVTANAEDLASGDYMTAEGSIGHVLYAIELNPSKNGFVVGEVQYCPTFVDDAESEEVEPAEISVEGFTVYCWGTNQYQILAASAPGKSLADGQRYIIHMEVEGPEWSREQMEEIVDRHMRLLLETFRLE